MICSHCGADNKDDAVKCAKCGEALTSVPDKNIQKKSSAASRIRKIAVDHGDFGSHREHRAATEHTLEDVMNPSTGNYHDEKKVNVEDTLDLSKFHLDRIQLEDDVQKDSDGQSRIAGMSVSESGGPAHDKKSSGFGKNRKRNWFLWILTGVVLVAVLAAAVVFIYLWKNPKKDYADIILEGNRYYQEAYYEKAEEMYFQALEMNPEGAEGYFCLADVYIAMNHPQKAAEILKKGYDRTKSEQLEKRLYELTNNQKASGDMTVPEESTQTEDIPDENPTAKILGESAAAD